MKKQDEVSEIRERFTDGSGDAEQVREKRAALKAVGVIAAVLVATVACGVMFASCGSPGDSSAQASASGQSPSADVSQHASVALSSGLRAPVQGGLSAADTAVREGLPPDLSVSVGDTLVKPGQALEFTVQGTPDVAEVALSDGRDEPMPLVRDKGTDTWRTQYRVPLHPRQERFGISVTAKTEASRWRRVWIFLHVASSDSTKADTTQGEDVDEGC